MAPLSIFSQGETMSITLTNCSKQNVRYCCLPPEHTKTLVIEVPSGQQRQFGHNFTHDQVQAVIAHMEKHGYRQKAEISRRNTEFSGVVYSLDKPATESQIQAAHEMLVDSQERRSAAEATKSALAFDQATRDPKDRRKRLARVTEVSVKQDIPKTEKPTGKEIEFSVSVSPDGATDLKLPA